MWDHLRQLIPTFKGLSQNHTLVSSGLEHFTIVVLSIQTSALRASPHYVNLHYCGSELASSTMGLNLPPILRVRNLSPVLARKMWSCLHCRNGAEKLSRLLLLLLTKDSCNWLTSNAVPNVGDVTCFDCQYQEHLTTRGNQKADWDIQLNVMETCGWCL